MGLFLVGVVLILLFIIFYIIFNRTDIEVLMFVAAACLALGLGLTVVYGIAKIVTTINNEITYQNMLEQKTAIEYRLNKINNDENVLVNGGVYNDLVEYNNELRKYKKWSNNFWTKGLIESKPAELDYIVLGDNK